MKTIKFFAPGVPQTAGSKKGFINPKTNRVIVVDSNPKGSTTWRATIQGMAMKAKADLGLQGLILGPVSLSVKFYFSRPKSHYRAGKNAHLVNPNAPECHTKRPDATKCLRALEDALNGVVWKDDSQVVDQLVQKKYGEQPGAEVEITF